MKSLDEFASEEIRAGLNDADLIAEAEGRGFLIYKPQPKGEVIDFDTSRLRGKRVRVALISDTHYGSRFQQATFAAEFCRYAERVAKVDAFIHGGDLVDGPLEMHKGAIHNLFLSTYDAQRQYAIDTLPKTKAPFYIISGNHDESYLKNAGGDLVRDVANARGLTWLGQSQGFIRFGDILFEVDHPHDGMAYALSYKLQRRIEALSPERKPHILCLGNYHKSAHLPAYRNVDGFLLPAFQAQTPFMASKGLASIVGGVILEFGIVASGLAPSLKVEWMIWRQALSEDFPH